MPNKLVFLSITIVIKVHMINITNFILIKLCKYSMNFSTVDIITLSSVIIDF